MITVKGRDLIIPVNERQIGTTYDNNAETRRIRMERAPVRRTLTSWSASLLRKR